ncbi:MAG: hypothetical protein FJY73_06895 [Candidatus Eisenbacteria bacterium]|nr:hypothetical protein [Candidatus Eisenbacteria bacterium]
MKSPTRRMVLAVCALIVLLAPLARAAGDPIWSVRIEGEAATLVTNDFSALSRSDEKSAPAGDFPLSVLRVKRVVDRSEVLGDRLVPHIRLQVAPLYVNTDGTLRSNELTFVPDNRASKDLEGDDSFAFLAQPGGAWGAEAEALAKVFPVSFVNLRDMRHQQINTWIRSPDGSKAAAVMEVATFFFDAQSGAPPGPFPRVLYLHPLHSTAVSSRLDRIAGIARDGDEEWVVAFRFDGRVFYEEPHPTGYVYDQLQFVPNGETLIYDRKAKGGRAEAVVLDLRNGETKTLEGIPEGYRYYSRDGRRLLILRGEPGRGPTRAEIFDSSDPLAPSPLPGSYSPGDQIVTAAVSDDGSAVALQVRNGFRNPPTTRVVLLDGDLNEVDVLLSETTMQGLHFAGKILFVGYQKHPNPVLFVTTEEIRAYDCSR